MHLDKVRGIVNAVFDGSEESCPGVFDCGCVVIVFEGGAVSVKPDRFGVQAVTDAEALRDALVAVLARLEKEAQ